MLGQFTMMSGLANTDEMLVLFQWDGMAPLVTDIDYLLYGNNSDAMDKTGIISNMSKSGRQLAQEMNLDLYADFVVTSGDVGQGKPHSPIYLAALAHASAEPGQSIHVGDSISADVEGALVAGIRPVYMNRYPDVPQEETVPQGVPIVHTLADVEVLLGL